MDKSAKARAPNANALRNLFWKRQARLWHWMSGAICLIGMLGFAMTGVTLNHAAAISPQLHVSEQTLTLPDSLVNSLAAQGETQGSASLPLSVADYLNGALNAELKDKPAEWTDFDVYVPLPRPGGDAWLSIDRETGEVVYEVTNRGFVAFLNDLHKGRNTGAAWSFFIDVFAVATVVFCLTGLWLLFMHARGRASTWPLVLAGFSLPGLLVVFMMHF